MASLVEIAGSRSVPLQAEHVVGRAPTCALRLDPRYVSAQHALIRWTGQRWELKDLSSTNGTFLDGTRVEAGGPVSITKGSRVAFGRPEACWELADDAPPTLMVVPVDGGDPVLIASDLLALPSAEAPLVTLYRDAAAGWFLEQPDETTQSIQNLHMFEAGGRWWRFCCPDDAPVTTHATEPVAVLIQGLELIFHVSRNEEYVALSIRCNGRVISLGAHERYFTLLTLARRRLDDHEAGLPASECGWLCPADYPYEPRLAPSQLALDVHRIREKLSKNGVADFGKIIERRAQTRELRIGTSKLTSTRREHRDAGDLLIAECLPASTRRGPGALLALRDQYQWGLTTIARVRPAHCSRARANRPIPRQTWIAGRRRPIRRPRRALLWLAQRHVAGSFGAHL